MNRADFLAATLANANTAAILQRLAAVRLPDAWLVSGALFQSAWNAKTGRAPTYGIRDYDIFYFDADTSWRAEDSAIKRAQAMFADLGIAVEVRNQARVHLWYQEKFGAPYSPATCATDGIDRFLMPCAQVGVRSRNRAYDVYAPAGFSDIANLIVRPNRTANFRAAPYSEKCARWKRLWPELTIEPAEWRPKPKA
jgi:hypothetical protein